jgi:hypothetical protein
VALAEVYPISCHTLSALHFLTVSVMVIGFSGLSNSSRWVADLVYHLHASKDFAEDDVGLVQPAAVCDPDMALL